MGNNLQLTKDDFNFLKKGMSYQDIKKIVGEASSPIGFGVIVLRYNLSDGSFMMLNFGSDSSNLLNAYIKRPDGKTEYLVNWNQNLFSAKGHNRNSQAQVRGRAHHSFM